MSLEPQFFRDETHKNAFYILLNKCRRVNEEVVPVMYLLSLVAKKTEDDKYNISACCDGFDFDEMHIKPESLKHSWHTSSTSAAFRLAFILWNGYPSERSQKFNNIYFIFGHGWDKYLCEAIRLRFVLE